MQALVGVRMGAEASPFAAYLVGLADHTGRGRDRCCPAGAAERGFDATAACGGDNLGLGSAILAGQFLAT